MRHSWKNRILAALLVLFFGTGFMWSAFRTPDAVSVTERRKLAQMPALTWKRVWDGTFFSDFETYCLDQFPLRDKLRTVKAALLFDVLRQKDNNGIYIVDGAVYKTEYPTDLSSVAHAADKMEEIYAAYLDGTDCKAYLAVIPDKNYYTAAKNGYPALDYDAVRQAAADGTPDLVQIDLFKSLDADAYYRTDTHWRQERLSDVVTALATGMGVSTLPLSAYSQKEVYPFYGVYYGQSALPLAPDTLTVLNNDTLLGCNVTNYETGKTTGVYTWDKLSGMDAYDVFLSGACPMDSAPQISPGP